MKSFYCLFLVAWIAFNCASCISLGKKGPEHFYFGSYSEAEKHFNSGEYDQAILHYQTYLDENPNGNLAVIATYYLAKSHAALGNTEEAKSRFQSIVKNHPDLVWAKFSETQIQELDFSASEAE